MQHITSQKYKFSQKKKNKIFFLTGGVNSLVDRRTNVYTAASVIDV